MIKLW